MKELERSMRMRKHILIITICMAAAVCTALIADGLTPEYQTLTKLMNFLCALASTATLIAVARLFFSDNSSLFK